ncbi:MAG: hypothetical protein EZS28_021202 [Streblomastix strix]|uniref:Uncharacterized protein n=1 Tax=Streblomastix strix TaxID=222440 RepID=A0A5J4VKU7_9EUKA|nr:MAG: hypothetical protein EZS28_021202 [Streblomastix strix]
MSDSTDDDFDDDPNPGAKYCDNFNNSPFNVEFNEVIPKKFQKNRNHKPDIRQTLAMSMQKATSNLYNYEKLNNRFEQSTPLTVHASSIAKCPDLAVIYIDMNHKKSKDERAQIRQQIIDKLKKNGVYDKVGITHTN